jgi:acyl carrier protein
MNLENDIREMLAQVMEDSGVNFSEVGAEDNLYELGFGSFNAINFVVLAEEKYGIEMDDTDLIFSNYDTVKNIVSLLGKYVNA